MNIHELNTKALTDPAYVAFDDGTDTYKVEFNDVMEDKAAEAVAAADLTQNEVVFTSGDAASPTVWSNVEVITTGSTLATLFNRISTMVKNVRYLWNLIGTTAMGTTATTITGAIKEHETDISALMNMGNVTTRNISGTVDVASSGSAVTAVVDSTFPAAGTYLVIGSLTFPANATGMRAAGYAVGTTDTITVQRTTSTMAASSGSTMLQCVGVETVAAAGTALKLFARQNSGSTLTVQYARITLVRLK